MALIADVYEKRPSMLAMLTGARHDFSQYRAKRARVRQIENELYAMNDRELNDLGISRADIRAVARS